MLGTPAVGGGASPPDTSKQRQHRNNMAGRPASALRRNDTPAPAMNRPASASAAAAVSFRHEDGGALSAMSSRPGSAGVQRLGPAPTSSSLRARPQSAGPGGSHRAKPAAAAESSRARPQSAAAGGGGRPVGESASTGSIGVVNRRHFTSKGKCPANTALHQTTFLGHGGGRRAGWTGWCAPKLLHLSQLAALHGATTATPPPNAAGFD